MLRQTLVLLALVTFASAAGGRLNHAQLNGLKRLLKNMDAGTFATCNIVFFSKPVTYNEADNNCKNFDIGSGRGENGNLVTVNDDLKNSDLKLLLEMAYPAAEPEQANNKWGPTSWVWAGLRKTKNNNNKKPGKYSPGDWEWADGSNPKDFYKWMKKQPDQRRLKKGKSGCDEKYCYQNQMRINHRGLWDDTYKFKKHPYACDYKGKYILSGDKVTWAKAKDKCAAAGLFLASVRNPAEVEEMKEAAVYFLGKADPAWKTWDDNNWIWLGGNDKEEEGTWKWQNGDLVEDWAVPWRAKAGKDNAGRGQHALAFSRWGEFDDSFHKKKIRLRPFACQCPGS